MKKLPYGLWWGIWLMLVGLTLNPGSLAAENVYLMSTGYNVGDTALVNSLTAFGHTVTLGVQKQHFDGSQSLSGYDVVLLTDSYNWNSGVMPNAGQTALLNFVNNGGGLITSEWTLWAGSQFSILAPAFPAFYGGAYNYASSTTYTAQTSDPIMNYNLPGAFTFSLTNIAGTESKVAAKAGATVFFTSSNFNAVGVAGWNYGQGYVVNFSTLMATVELADANYRQLLSNAVNWAGQAVVVPLPATWLLVASGFLGLLGWRRRQ